MAFTTKQDVILVFESTFQDKTVLPDSLILQWFKMAVCEFSVEIEPLKYDYEDDKFLYYEKDNNGESIIIELPDLYSITLGYLIKKYYCEREYEKALKRTNIIGKDITINNTKADKDHFKSDLDYVNAKVNECYDKLKNTAYGN